MMKGIILAGGNATRLRPASYAVSKQLMPVYDKPLIYYPLTTLMLSGIRDILIITSPEELTNYQRLFLRHQSWGIKIQFVVQPDPGGLAEALIIGEEFLSGEPSTLILGDNLFHGAGLGRSLQESFSGEGAQIAAYRVADPRAFGVVEFDEKNLALSLEEKPLKPKSHWAVPGIYQYDSTASTRAKNLGRSARGELEITDLNKTYMRESALKVRVFPRGTTWLDMGTPNSLLEASEYIRVIQERQGQLVGSPEEAAWSMGWIDNDELIAAAKQNGSTEYCNALIRLVEEV
jgi:glucose-1-phosphate thymidylyltransferase